MTRAQSADLEAYGEIVRRFQDMAYGYAYSILGDFHLAEDAAQEAFIDAYRRLDQLREPAAFPGWFRKICFKHCDRMTRGRCVPTGPLDAGATVASQAAGPAEAAERHEMKDAVLEAIRSLPEGERTATTLFYINGYSQKEIADFLEVPVTTVNNRLHASRKRLKERMMNMVKDELQKNPLPEGFRQRVLTLAQIIATGLGQLFLFHFSNGVRMRTRVDEVVRGDVTGRLLALVCGPTDIYLPNEPQGPRHAESYLLIPDSILTVSATTEAREPVLYERTAASRESEPEPSYTSAPVVQGPLEVMPAGFGFVRFGKRRQPYAYRDEQGQKQIRHAVPEDIFVSVGLIQKHGLKTGDQVECSVRSRIGSERFRSAVTVKRAS